MNTKEIAWEFIKKHGINTFNLKKEDVEDIVSCYDNWDLMSYNAGAYLIKKLGLQEHARSVKAFTCAFDDNEGVIQFAILYKDELPYDEKLAIVFHEIGHIVLNHTYSGCILGKAENAEKTDEQEREADIFACEVMAPSCILRDKFGVDTVEGIQKISRLPEEYAYQHCGEMHREKQRTTDYQLVKDMYAQYEGFVSSIKKEEATKRVKGTFKKPSFLLSVIIALLIAVVGLSAFLIHESMEKSTVEQPPYSPTNSVISPSPSVFPSINPSSVPAMASPSPSPVPESPSPTPTTTPEEIMVYVTPAGSKYHKASCRYAQRDDVIELSLSKAQKRYAPCLVCNPDED